MESMESLKHLKFNRAQSHPCGFKEEIKETKTKNQEDSMKFYVVKFSPKSTL